MIFFLSSKRTRPDARNFAVNSIFIPLKHLKKKTALQNKVVGVLRTAFWIRKVFGTFEKRDRDDYSYRQPPDKI